MKPGLPWAALLPALTVPIPALVPAGFPGGHVVVRADANGQDGPELLGQLQLLFNVNYLKTTREESQL